jgi:hypothetical protein
VNRTACQRPPAGHGLDHCRHEVRALTVVICNLDDAHDFAGLHFVSPSDDAVLWRIQQPTTDHSLPPSDSLFKLCCTKSWRGPRSTIPGLRPVLSHNT